MPARNTASAVIIASVSAAVVAAVLAVAHRWRRRTAAHAYRAGFAAGLVWSVVRGLGTWLRDGIRRDDGQEQPPSPDIRALLRVRADPGARASLKSVLDAPLPRDPQLGDKFVG